MLTRNLDTIAAKRQLVRPHTEPCRQVPLQVSPHEGQAVYKRSYSARSAHVIVRDPNQQSVRPENVHTAALRISTKSGAEQETGCTGIRFIDNAWVKQVYLENLLNWRYGELRCYVIDGRVRRVIQTAPWNGGTWTDELSQCLPLEVAV